MAGKKRKPVKKARRKYKCPKCGTVYVSNPRLRKKSCEECGPVDKPVWINE